MADWLYIGYCTVMAMFVVAAAYAAVVGLRALRRLPRSLLLGFATAAIVATLTAQKTNNVPPNMNQPQMMQGGVSQTGLTGLPFPVPHSPFPIANPVQNNILVQTTNADISRGWRVESVATNAAVSYVMPTNAMRVGNWHIHGASSSFGNNVVDFGVLRTSGTLVPTNWSFPLGTNDEAFSSFWYFIDGRLRPAPRDAVHEICAVAVPMSAVPGQSRLWRFDGEDGSRILTWENFFLGGDTNCPVNAQIVLSPNGDFITRSNDVETVCRRINPDDWDDDGIHNERDANPTVCDGDFFGPSNILPAGANTNAYYTISVVATGPDALVTFTGDKPCNYPDPRFVAKSGVTNEVVILIGKTYAISSDWPFAVVGVSDPETEVWQMRGAAHQTYACRPVTISASDGNPFTMSVVPLNLGGVFLWPSAQCSCSISGGGDTFAWNCPMGCTCCGCTVEGQYSYEGYWLPATSCLCGCYYDGTGPKWDPSSAPLAASVSASFSKSAVIFEDAYENEPGRWVGKNSTRTRLNIVANGGPDGGTLSVTSTNIGKLSRISGPDLPLASVAVPAETQVSYSIVYEGATASTTADDIVVTATIIDCDTSDTLTNECAMTSIRLELSPVWEAPENPCTNRHVYGVGERVKCRHVPQASSLSWDIVGLEYNNSLLSGDDCDCILEFSYIAAEVPNLRASWNGVEYRPELALIEPTDIECRYAEWDGFHGAIGVAGGFGMNLDLYVLPMTVSFQGIDMVEEPCNEVVPPTGYYASTNFNGELSHTLDAQAGWWNHVKQGNRWTLDNAFANVRYPPWSDGIMHWKIPVAWYQRFAGEQYSWPRNSLEAVRRRMAGSELYLQIFTMTENGTVSVGKFEHIISRTTNDVIRLDGVIVNH